MPSPVGAVGAVGYLTRADYQPSTPSHLHNDSPIRPIRNRLNSRSPPILHLPALQHSYPPFPPLSAAFEQHIKPEHNDERPRPPDPRPSPARLNTRKRSKVPIPTSTSNARSWFLLPPPPPPLHTHHKTAHNLPPLFLPPARVQTRNRECKFTPIPRIYRPRPRTHPRKGRSSRTNRHMPRRYGSAS